MNKDSTLPTSMRARLWLILEGSAESGKIGRICNFSLSLLILVNVLCAIIGTVDGIFTRFSKFLSAFELFSIFIFSTEYILRLWACTASARYKNPIGGRIRYILTPVAIIDLIAILPFFLPFVQGDLRTLRLLRLLRLLWFAKLGRYSAAIKELSTVFRSRKEELLLAFGLTVTLLLASSSILYFIENGAQPDKFSSIPATMWWAVSTLTTVGYGDIYPVTPLGKIFAGMTAFLGVGLFALPTAILGSAFLEIAQKKRSRICPHCGKEL